MILAQNITAVGGGGWYQNTDSSPTVPLRFVFPGGGTVRVDGRNNDSDTPVNLGYAYNSGILVVPRFNQYRVYVTNLNTGGALTLAERASVRLQDDYDVRVSPLLQNRGRVTPRGLRKGGLRTSHVCPFETYGATNGTTITADRFKVETGTAVKDYVNCRSGEVQSGETAPFSIALTATSGVTAEIRYDYRVSNGGAGPVDLSGGTGKWPFIILRVYVDPSQQSAQSGNVQNISIGFHDTTLATATKTMANFQQFDSSAVCGPGWNTLVLHPTTVGTVNPADVHFIRIYLNSKTGTSCTVTFDSLQFITPTPSTKLVAFRDDDGYAGCIYTAMEFDKWGIRGNFHVHPQLVGTSGYASKADLLAMQRAGHMIGNHGWSKYEGDINSGVVYINSRTLTAEKFWTDYIRPAAWWLQDNGFEQGSRIYATHQGNMTPEQSEYLLEAGLDVISHTSTASEDATTTNHIDFLEVQHATGYNTTVSQGLLDALDDHGGLAVFYGHANRSQEQAFMKVVTDAVVPRLKDGTYRCVTLAEAVSGSAPGIAN
jgi:hypothetical protein